MEHDKKFNEDGYVVVKNFIDEVTISTISRYFENRINRREWILADDCPITKYGYYADPLIEVLLNDSKEEVENVIGEELIPTYSYSRVYRPGETLEPHIDRPSCEISVTVNVASMGDPSFIYMKYPGKDINKYSLEPGDAVIYQGCVVEHWRDTLDENQLNVQFMLHYVKRNGKFKDFKFDKREQLGLPNINKKNY